ncbi:soluble scavenger receptor cysteine-rich domain-containing protein SSC5D isoform X2 [Sorex araneus]|uniref:soluble scavenger receptor cysteine-rich domain-containing protein SSC5D isoform X2 n=1 Tax=Sorex araneus TaxID=42254 RepID=UPI002433AFC9|nr:soluble scavenger receptor cysteine-rich domain-containing protein SSC5D isoform X2 [Sorex araneus]
MRVLACLLGEWPLALRASLSPSIVTLGLRLPAAPRCRTFLLSSEPRRPRTQLCTPGPPARGPGIALLLPTLTPLAWPPSSGASAGSGFSLSSPGPWVPLSGRVDSWSRQGVVHAHLGCSDGPCPSLPIPVPPLLPAALMGIQAVERLRLADGPHSCAGRLEVRHGGHWGTVCDDGWDLRDAAVVCRALGCGGALAAPGGAFFGEGTGPVWLSELDCHGGEAGLGLCTHRGWKAHVCSHEEDAGAVCAGQRVADMGDGDQSASSLNEDPLLLLSGALSPDSEEPPQRSQPTGIHAPHQAGTPQNSTRKKSPRPPKPVKSTRAPVLSAGAPRQERLRLVSGPHDCAGRLEVKHAGRWGTVCDDGWDLRDAAVACRELGCGEALAAPGEARFGTGAGPVWMDDVGCRGSELALRDCPRRPWGRSNCDHSEDAGLVCSGPAPRLRLADGPHGCAGRLEVWHAGVWGTVCDDGWDLRDATVACRALGCGGALAAPGGAFFGEGPGPILLDNVRCRGNETALSFCPARPWGQHDCHHREDAGAVCDGLPLLDVPLPAPASSSNGSTPRGATRPESSVLPAVSRAPSTRTADMSHPPASPTASQESTPKAGSPRLRLVAGPSRCSGRLEVWHSGRWGTVCDDAWDLRDAAVACRELGCGAAGPQDPAMGRFGWGSGPIWLDDVGCVGTEASLSDCPAAPWGKHNCAHNEDVEVTCTGTPGLDDLSDPLSWSWNPDAWLPVELVTKHPVRLTTSVTMEKPTSSILGKMPKSTRKWARKGAKWPTTKGPQGHPELTSQAISPTTEALPRLPSHTSAAQTPWDLTTQDPQDMTSGGTTQHSPLTSVGASPPSSKDPSPTGNPVEDSGLFRIRLADGPNRCAGRLEVRRAGRWGTVCDDGWDLRDATVVCRELGCGRVRPRVGKTHYGPGTGPIWLDDVGCRGAEDSLSHCMARPWGQHNCDHEEDVGLTCTGHADADDYPPWTWDPTSGEDLAKGIPNIGLPSNTPPATRHLPDGEEDSEPSWMWDTPSRGTLAQGTPTASPSQATAAVSTTSSPDRHAPASRAHGDQGASGSGQRKPERRTPRPAAHGAATPTASPAPATGPAPPEPSSTPRTPPRRSAKATSSRGLTLPAVSRELASDPSMPMTVPGRTPTSALSPEPRATQHPTMLPESSRSSDSPTTLQPTTTPPPVTVLNPATTPQPPTSTPEAPTVTPHPPTEAPYPSTTSHIPPTTPHPPTTTPQSPTMTPHPTTAPHFAVNPDAIATPGLTPQSPVTASGTELPTPAPTVQASGLPALTSVQPLRPSTPTPWSPESPPASASAPAVDTALTGAPRNPSLTPQPTWTPHSASGSQETPDHGSLTAPPSQPPPSRPLQPPPEQNTAPTGPCVAPEPPLRVMACEPAALVELVAAVREVGAQLQRLTGVLERDQQERQALSGGLSQLLEAAQGLGQLGEAMRELARGAWHARTASPPTAILEEEEERPLRGDV